MTLKERTGVLEIPLGGDFGGGEARKRFVEQGGDSLLLGKRWDRNKLIMNVVPVQSWHPSPTSEATQIQLNQ